jgi:peptide methionine sulfoxide reductase MsrB
VRVYKTDIEKAKFIVGASIVEQDDHVVVRLNGWAFTAEAYAKLFEPGVYRCATCGDTLYDHTAKFVGPCLWPSFRAPHHPTKSLHCIDVAPGAYNQYTCAVKELYCKKCRLFLGHAFEDGATTGDTHPEARWRHCVLSLSLMFGALD